MFVITRINSRFIHAKTGWQLRLIAVLLPLFISCDWLYMEPLSLRDWSPQKTSITDMSSLEISMSFSAPVDRHSVYKAFKLLAQGEPIPGSFSWPNPKKFIFKPIGELSGAKTYSMQLGTELEDLNGNSPLSSFYHEFRGHNDQQRPYILAVEDNISSERAPVKISFSEPVDQASFYRSFSISPSIKASFRWQDTKLSILPYEDWVWGLKYRIQITPSLKDRFDNYLAQEFKFDFSYGVSTPKAELISIESRNAIASLSSSSHKLLAENGVEKNIVAGIDTQSKFYLEFDRSMDTQSMGANISFTPYLEFRVTPLNRLGEKLLPATSNSRFFIIELQEPALFDKYYRLFLSSSIRDLKGLYFAEQKYNFHTNGIYSRPIRVSRISYSTKPRDPTSMTELLYGANIDLDSYSTTRAELGLIHIELEHALASLINLQSLRTKLTTRVLGSRSIFAITGIELQASKTAKTRTTAVVHLDVLNDPSSQGFIQLSIAAGLYDNFNNKLQEDWLFRVNKK